MRFAMEDTNTETTYILVLSGKMPKNMRFAMKNPNTETAYN